MGEEQLNHTIPELGAPLSQSDGRLVFITDVSTSLIHFTAP